jgi:hypothetical protein
MDRPFPWRTARSLVRPSIPTLARPAAPDDATPTREPVAELPSGTAPGRPPFPPANPDGARDGARIVACKTESWF